MTTAILVALFVLPLGSIALDLRRDELDLPPLGLARHLRMQEAEFDRLTAPLPEWRESLLPVDWHETWPQRQTPSDGLIVGEDRPGRHEVGVAAGSLEQQARWNSPTGQFWVIVDRLRDLEEPCAHCATPEDGEPAHAGCPGCCCPCTLVGAANA